MTETTNLHLTKDAPEEYYSVERVNANSDKIDAFAGDVATALQGKQDVLTFDTTPTAGSEKPVTSGGIYIAMNAKVETSTYATDKAALDAEIAEDRAALAEVENKGAKNLAPNTAKSETVSTVSFTVKSDGTVLANGTASTAAWFMTAENLTLQPGTYVISGGQKADGTVNVRVVFSTSETAADIIADSNGESTEFTITSATTANVYVRMSTGRTANNVTVCPMICTKAEWDISHQFEPYALPNPTLTPAMIKTVDEGAKNLFRFNNVGRSSTYGASYTQNGITVTVDSDVGLTVSGTAGTGGAFVNIGLDSETPHLINTLCDGQHILSGGSAKARLNARANSQTNYSVYDTGNGTVLTATSYTGAIFVSVSVEEGVSFSSSETIYPMICTAADWAVSKKFVPYCPTLYELYQMVLALQSGTRSLSMQPETLTNGEEPETESREEER